MNVRCWKCGDYWHLADACSDPEPPKWIDIDRLNPEWVEWHRQRRDPTKEK